MKRFLSNTVAYPWTIEENINFRGYFIKEDTCCRGKGAVDVLYEHLSERTAASVLRELNGSFSMIQENSDSVLFAVDRLRSLPLFYAVVDGELWLGDDAVSLAKALPHRSINEVSAEEFISTSTFVSGPYTMLNELFQVQAGELCVFRNGTVTRIQYFQTEHDDFFDDQDTETLLRNFQEAYARTGRAMVQALNGRTAVIPLSGGADSRMILNMLKKEQYEKVLCFTYGHPGNREAEISHMVAKEFGYPWVMVPYTTETWETLRNDPIMSKYEPFAFSFCSTPHLQDFPAVRYMKEHGMLPEDSVFVPGHSGDMIAGSHITFEFLKQKMSREDFFKTIHEKFYVDDVSQALNKKIEERFPPKQPHELEKLASQSEWFNTQERQAKFIVNSVRIYEFLGYEWLIPLWDNHQFDFWKRVSLSWRYRRKLYYYAVNDQLPSTNDVTIADSTAAKLRTVPGIRTVLRRGKRILKYWRSPLRTERYIAPAVYFRACLFAPPTFTIASLTSKQLLVRLRKTLEKNEKT